MKTETCFVGLFLLFCIYRSTAQNQEDLKTLFRKHFAKYVEPGNTLFDAGPNYSVERTANGHYLKKTYYFETGRQTTGISYADSLLIQLNGFAVEWYDDGRLWSEGTYTKGMKTGFWKEKDSEFGLQLAYGEYVNGKKEGQWIAFDSLKNKCEAQYKDGKIEVATIQCLNPDGTVDSERLKRVAVFTGGDADFMDVPPSFPCRRKYKDAGEKCGERSLLDFLSNNIEYPAKAREIGIEGTAILEFVVDKDGSVIDVIVLRGICDDIKKECLRVVKQMPKWNPGMVDGESVKVRFTLPVRFRLG